MRTKFCLAILKGGDQSHDLGGGSRILLKQIVGKFVLGLCTGCIWHGMTYADSCEPLGSVKGGAFLEKLNVLFASQGLSCMQLLSELLNMPVCVRVNNVLCRHLFLPQECVI